ncbi:unnamed protein product [Caenorhabditis angaria]|uniref:C-type lectin domain-containing protein n=1 Tax=Caenorhabditis angaria TaxID=860376 RepID=A0A9P1I8C4_9PELO|nr:unnamed protein product [Caenorhabditis angaria]
MILKILMVFLCVQLMDSCRLRCRNRTTETCDDGWTYYKRNTTGWCMKVFVVTRTNDIYINKTIGENFCEQNEAVISSIDDLEMYNFTMTLKAATHSNYTWLGATLDTQCQCPASYCADPNDLCGAKAYYWTDGYTTSNDFLLNYLPVTPTKVNGVNVYLNRAGVYLIANDSPSEFRVGQLYIANVSTKADSVLCGKPATIS